MLVTEIRDLGKSRCLIYIDGQSSFVLYRGELKAYSIEEQKEITSETYDLILSEVLAKRARLRAMNLLMKHSFTEAKLREKLVEGFYPETIINNAIDYVSSYGYVDDVQYAYDYISYNSDKKSEKRITQDLLNKGVSRDNIKTAFEKMYDNNEHIDEEAQIRALLEKRHYNPNDSTFEDAQKHCAFLLRKGYRMDTIRRIINLT